MLLKPPALAAKVVVPGATPVTSPVIAFTVAWLGALLTYALATLPWLSVVVHCVVDPSE